MSNVRCFVRIARVNLAIALVPGSAVLLSVLAAASFNAWALGECDSKFGCAGGVQFALLVGCVGALLAWVGGGAAVAVARRRVLFASRRAVGFAIAITSMLLVVIFPTVSRWPFSDLGLVVGWLLLSAVATWVAIWSASHAST